MTGPATLSPADMALIVEYLDGNLDEEAMLAFEERLELEPELARALEDFEGIDLVQRANVAPRPPGAILGPLVEEQRSPPPAWLSWARQPGSSRAGRARPWPSSWPRSGSRTPPRNA